MQTTETSTRLSASRESGSPGMGLSQYPHLVLAGSSLGGAWLRYKCKDGSQNLVAENPWPGTILVSAGHAHSHIHY